MKSFTAIKEMDDDILSVFIHNDDNEDYDYEYEYNMIDTNTKINTNANSSDIQCITKSYCEITLSNIIICNHLYSTLETVSCNLSLKFVLFSK